MNFDLKYLARAMGKTKIMTNHEIKDLQQLGFVVDVIKKIPKNEWQEKNWVSPEAYEEYLIKEALAHTK